MDKTQGTELKAKIDVKKQDMFEEEQHKDIEKEFKRRESLRLSFNDLKKDVSLVIGQESITSK